MAVVLVLDNNKPNVAGPAQQAPLKLIRGRPVSPRGVRLIKDRALHPRHSPPASQQPHRLQRVDHRLLGQGVLQPRGRQLQITRQARREVPVLAA